MIRTQIQLPDKTYARAKRVCAAHEMSLAELARRGIEDVLAQYSESDTGEAEWKVPILAGTSLKVPLRNLKAVAHEIEEERSQPRKT